LGINELDSAEGWFRSVLEIAPNHVESKYWLGQVLEKRGETVEAIDLYDDIKEQHLGAKSALKRLKEKQREKQTQEQPIIPKPKPPDVSKPTGHTPWYVYVVFAILDFISLGILIAKVVGSDPEGIKMGYGCLLLSWVAFCLVSAFFIYGIKEGILTLVVLSFLLGVGALLGWIPVAGPFLYWWVAKSYLMPLFFRWFPEIARSWLTSLIFWSCLASSVGYTIRSIKLISSD
jgi:tetratricopeptide (TPR) repeat protein